MGWHSFKRFRKTWLRGTRCLEDINNFWMAHKPHTMSEVYSHLHEEVEMRLDEAARVGFGFVLPAPSMRRPVDVKAYFAFFFSVSLLPFSQAASVAILPSALFCERYSLGARWVFSFQ